MRVDRRFDIGQGQLDGLVLLLRLAQHAFFLVAFIGIEQPDDGDGVIRLLEGAGFD